MRKFVNSENMVSTLTISKATGIQHKSIIRLIRKHKDILEKKGVLVALAATDSSSNLLPPFYYLNQPQAFYLLERMRQFEKTFQAKLLIADEFLEDKIAKFNEILMMEAENIQLKAEKRQLEQDLADYLTEPERWPVLPVPC